MTNPYAQPYDSFKGMGKVAGPSKAEQQQQQSSGAMADILRMLGGVAPAAGSAIGAGIGGLLAAPAGGVGIIPGMQAGAALGGMAGQVAGGLAGGGANMVERGPMERQAARDRQIEMLLAAFGRGR